MNAPVRLQTLAESHEPNPVASTGLSVHPIAPHVRMRPGGSPQPVIDGADALFGSPDRGQVVRTLFRYRAAFAMASAWAAAYVIAAVLS